MDPADKLPLPFPLSDSSSNLESKFRPIHASNCSHRPRKSIIRLEEGWWGSAVHGSAQSMIKEDSREMDRRIKRRRLSATTPASQDYWQESSYGGARAEAESALFETDDLSISSNPRNDSRRGRYPSPPSLSKYESPQDYPRSSIRMGRKRLRSVPARQSHPWLSSQPALPPLRRSPTPPPAKVRTAVSVLDTPIVVLTEGLEFSDFAQFLSTQPIEPILSLSYYRIQIEFFTSVSPAVKWSPRIGSKIFNRPHWPTTTQEIMSLDLNFDFIRKQYPLELSSTRMTGPQLKNWEWDGIGKVLDWIYGVKLRMPEILWFVEHVPLPLLALSKQILSFLFCEDSRAYIDHISRPTVKIHSSTQGYARGIWGVSCQFEDYLDKTPSSCLTRVELRARELFDWLRADSAAGQGKMSTRWRNWWRDEVQRERDGTKAMWSYWLEDIEGLRTTQDLGRWEKDVRAAKRWRGE